MRLAVTVLIKQLQGANAFIEHATAALVGYIFRLITGEGGDDGDIMLAEEFRKPFEIILQQNGEIAAIDYLATGF